MRGSRKPASSRLLDRVDVSESGCWLWTGASNSHGYGVIWFNGRVEGAHRLSHLLFVGPIPAGHEVDHLCRTPQCVRPDHLEAVTNEVNTGRSTNPRGAVIRTGACQRGHAFTDFYVAPKTGKRHCRACHRLAVRRYAERKRLEATS